MDGHEVVKHWENFRKDPLRIFNPTGNFKDRENNRYALIESVRSGDKNRMWKYQGTIYNMFPVNDPSIENLLVDGEFRESISETQLISRASYHELSKDFPKDAK